MIKEAKSRYGIRYIPFVHDVIPVITPEYCVKGLIQEFVPWLIGILSFADGYLVNSRATAKDLEKIADFLGHPIPEPHVIRLDGEFSAIREASNGSNSIMRHRLVREPFVLFVGTIEARKNHLLAFDVWLKMIRKRGLEKTPMLVCVGKDGWLAEAAMARLNASELLQRRVLILSTVADDELRDLYQTCLFTIFPSSYEGWGLPVTEALCHGKIPLITAVASLPEAGGELAEYFDHLSERNMLEKLELLIDDEVYRTAREAEIRSSFEPRSWEDIGDEIVRCALRTDMPGTPSVVGDDVVSSAALFPPAETRLYYAFSRNCETTPWPGCHLGKCTGSEPLGTLRSIGAFGLSPGLPPLHSRSGRQIKDPTKSISAWWAIR
jgi:glycosyltransferase involved in cell wall biosynthesis